MPPMQSLWWAEVDYALDYGLATVLAALIRTGNWTANCVKWSIIEITYLHSIPTEVDTDLYSTKSTNSIEKGR